MTTADSPIRALPDTAANALRLASARAPACSCAVS